MPEIGDTVRGAHGIGTVLSVHPRWGLPIEVQFECGFRGNYKASELAEDYGEACNCAHRRLIFHQQGMVVTEGLEYIPCRPIDIIAALDLTHDRNELYRLLM